jgi:hypothetical protein
MIKLLKAETAQAEVSLKKIVKRKSEAYSDGKKKLLLILAIDNTYMIMETRMMNVFMTTAYSQRTKKMKNGSTALSA